ncbi:porin [Luteimonas cucumeris]|uniref:Porin n=1 Tax=Luteimonas cucumeris TaxID=985012 RepID=A0A562LAM4_9GAMM|nr:carbohydrate porin [Luteimonas cucumeris]TWI04658.1 porin [Luteimonas cucumeris]
MNIFLRRFGYLLLLASTPAFADDHSPLAGPSLDRKTGTGVVYFATGNDRPGPGERSASSAVEDTLAREDGIPQPEATRGRLLPDSDFSLSWTNFLTSPVAGDGDDRARLGGKFDGYATIAGTDIGLWTGLSVNAHAEFGYGRTVEPQGTGMLLPVNTALAFPRLNDEGFDLALNITQRFGDASLTVGKINMIDNAGSTPIVRSDGREGFQNIALAAPPTFTTPPSIFGALLRIPTTAGPIVTLGIWDPHTAVRRALPDDLFGDGVNGMAMLTQPVNVRGKRGFQSLMLSWTTERGFDLNDLPYLFLPPDSDVLFREARGGYIARYQFQQFIWQDPDDPSRGVGVFGQLSYVDDNPLPGNWSMSLGITGDPRIASRPADRFGVAYFRTSMSEVLRDGVAPIVNLGDEQGIEAFYSFAIGNNLVLTADAQVIDPADRSRSTAAFLGARARVTF